MRIILMKNIPHLVDGAREITKHTIGKGEKEEKRRTSFGLRLFLTLPEQKGANELKRPSNQE